MVFCAAQFSSRFGGIAVFASLFFSAALPQALAETDSAVAEFLSGINQTINQFTIKDDDNQASAMCASLINSFFDFGALAQVTSVGAWEKMDLHQRQAYRAGLLRRVGRECVYRNSALNGEPLKLISTRAGDGGDRLIATEIVKQGQSPSIVVWRVRPDARKRLRAIDVILDGRSLAIHARNDAKAILDRNDGDIDALIKSLGP